MRITCVINSLSTGGAERNLIRITNDAAERGDTVTLITFDDGTQRSFDLNPRIERVGLKLGTKASSGISKIRKLCALPFALRQAITYSKPDVVLSFMDQANLLTLVALIGTGVQCVVSERVNPEYSSLLLKTNSRLLKSILKFLRNILYWNAARLIVQTQRAANYFPGYLQSKIRVIPNPIFPPETRSPDNKVSRPEVILCVGRLDTQKRFDLVIDAFAALAQEFPIWRLRIIGDGPLKSQLLAQASHLGISEKVDFAGIVHPIENEYDMASIFMLASDYEGFPTALGEAMAHGMAVIATDCEFGPRELIDHEVNGLLCSGGDETTFKNYLKVLMQTPLKRLTLGDQARRIPERFSSTTILEQWNHLFTSLSDRAARTK